MGGPRGSARQRAARRGGRPPRRRAPGRRGPVRRVGRPPRRRAGRRGPQTATMPPWSRPHRSLTSSGRRSSATTRRSPDRSGSGGSPTRTTPRRGARSSFIEDFIRDAVLPLYANTHTESSGTGLQTTRFREDARRIIRDAVGGGDEHAVHLLRLGLDRGDQQPDRRAQPAPARRPRRALRPPLAHPARASGRSSSSARTSTTPTSCRGASRSPRSSPIREDPDGHDRPGAARTKSCEAHAAPAAARSAASPPRRT